MKLLKWKQIEVEIRTTENPLEQGMNALVLSEENCKYDYQNKCITNLYSVQFDFFNVVKGTSTSDLYDNNFLCSTYASLY